MTYSKHKDAAPSDCRALIKSEVGWPKKPPQGPSINIVKWPLQKRAAEGVDDEGRPSKK